MRKQLKTWQRDEYEDVGFFVCCSSCPYPHCWKPALTQTSRAYPSTPIDPEEERQKMKEKEKKNKNKKRKGKRNTSTTDDSSEDDDVVSELEVDDVEWNGNHIWTTEDIDWEDVQPTMKRQNIRTHHKCWHSKTGLDAVARYALYRTLIRWLYVGYTSNICVIYNVLDSTPRSLVELSADGYGTDWFKSHQKASWDSHKPCIFKMTDSVAITIDEVPASGNGPLVRVWALDMSTNAKYEKGLKAKIRNEISVPLSAQVNVQSLQSVCYIDL